MKFKVMRSEYQLQGELQPHIFVVSCKAINKLLRREREVVMVQVAPMASLKAIAVTHPQIQALIHKYAQVFEVPKSLPPSRDRIELLPNMPPVSVRPYRYKLQQHSIKARRANASFVLLS